MKKVMMMMAMLAVSFAAQAQTKFHDVEANEATGPVKSITMDMMGREQVTNFTKEGKMERADVSDAVYDAEGFLQSAKMTMMQGQSTTVKYTWENGHVTSQTLNMMGQDISIPYSDYEYDSHGNWISRKTTIMGNEMTQTRKLEYYE